MKKRTIVVLAVSLVLILLGSILAGNFNSSNGTVKVSRISFETERGTLSGLLYMPNGVDAKNPRPAISVTHGYLNSAEMQDANAIELSRRGYVVLALDMYDHGHSAGNKDNTGGFGNFWPRAQYDAVQYLYEQPYVLKDENGNGIIGVTGHSMGGFSSAAAMYFDELDFAQSGIRKIYCGLTEGADYQWTSLFLQLTPEVAVQNGGGRIQGKVAAQYDEFFFNADDAPAGTVRKKDFVSTTPGKTFLEQEAPQAGVWYDTADGGKRIVYEPAETHPWNHFSKTTTASAIEFYTTAFADYSTGIKDIAPTNQIWQWKECSECVALVGFILFIISLALILSDLPFFSQSKTELKVLPSVQGGAMKAVTCIILVLAILLPGLFFVGTYDGNAANKNLLFWLELVVTAAALVLACMGYMKNKDKRYLVGGCFALLAGAGLAVVLKTSLYTGAFWSAPVVNSVAYWTLCCALIALLVMSTVYVALKAQSGVKLADYGIALKPMAIIASLCTAVVTVAAGYAILFLMDALFKADFRIWTFAFKTFDANIVPAILRYLPTFLMFYIISTASITINTNTEKLQGVKGYLLAACLNAGGITLWLIYQYGTLFSTGVGAFPGSALSGIVLFAMVPTLAIAGCISRALYKKTGNVWTAAFVNGLLMTIMTVANTTVYYR